jgi:outer membrane protein insertion porin family
MRIGLRCLSSAAVLVFFSGLLYPQTRATPQQVEKILGISVEGNQLADPAAVIANSGLKVGEEITIPGDQVTQAIKRLWELHLFDDIRVVVDRKVADGVYLGIIVKEYPRFERVEFVGRD